MKITYEFIVASRDDSQLLAQSSVEQLSFPYFRCFGLDPLNLAHLYFLANGEPFCESYLLQFSVLHHDEDTCDSIVELPESFCERLAEINNDRVTNIIDNWEEKAGLSLSYWHAEFKRNVVLNLIELSKQCCSQRQSLMLKVCVDQQAETNRNTLH